MKSKSFYFTKSTTAFIAFFVFFTTLYFSWLLVHSFQKDKERSDELLLKEEQVNVEKKITNLFHDAYNATKLIEFVHYHSEYANFAEIANEIMQGSPYVKTMGIVLGEEVEHIYPLKGNEKAIGHNVFKDPRTIKGVKAALADSNIYFSGPYSLIQGGYGIIGRLPLYNEGKYGAFVTVMIDWDYFQKEIGITPSKNGKFAYLAKVYNEYKIVNQFLADSSTFFNQSTVNVQLMSSCQIVICNCLLNSKTSQTISHLLFFRIV